MRLKKAYDCDLCSEGSPLLAKGSADLNTNREMTCMAKKVKQSYSSGRWMLRWTITALVKMIRE